VTALWLSIALPLAGAAVLLLGGRATDAWGHLLGCATVIGSFVCGVILFAALLGRPADQREIDQTLFTWVPVGELRVDFGLTLDALSICFVLLITGVGALIHLYSVGYMSHDRQRRLFFAYLNLFVAAMLLLVLADNYLGLYLGWEGVGLASYLLIGFWSHKPGAAAAAKKAFVVNRVGDLGLAVALMVLFANVGSVSYDAVFAAAPQLSDGVLTAVGLLLLLGACGKSAQVPLQSWLGDAMEGPTPVSALIHAATMVTAGVYLIVRSGPVFNLAPAAQTAVVIVGALTLLFGAVIGCAKDDIKKALAASTMSQIGYMVMAAGLGPAGYAVAIMHLLTHGFFKAGLFLGAGSVMHAMDEETDMRRYGALRAALPITFVTFGLGYLAIIGVPPFAGFFSKDAIIETALDSGGVRGVLLGGAALLGAAITAFYMTRVMLLTFFGERRWAPEDHPHESPPIMTVPMIALAVGSVGAGQHPGELARTRGGHPRGAAPGAGLGRHRAGADRGGDRGRGRLPRLRAPPGATAGSRGRLGADGGGPPGPLRRRGQRGDLRPRGKPAHPGPGRGGRRGDRGDGRWPGHRGAPGLRRAARPADRVRPLLCAVDPGRRGPAGGRGPDDGVAVSAR